MSKKKLELFSLEQLEVIEDIVLKSRKGIILEHIKEIKEERKQQDDWNSKISVDEMAIDKHIIDVLKANGIYTEKDLLHADLNKIKGLMPSWKEKAEWAALTYDMSKLQKLPEGSTLMDAAKVIVSEIPKKEAILEKKYGKK